jgi:hypothetical protein
MTIRFPRNSHNVDLSVPHRLIALLLERDYLSYDSLKDDGINWLLNGDEYMIQIKANALHLPIFLKANPRGLSLTQEPMSAKSLSVYIKERAREYGIVAPGNSLDISLYAWRRQAGNSANTFAGESLAQKLLLMPQDRLYSVSPMIGKPTTSMSLLLPLQI